MEAARRGHLRVESLMKKKSAVVLAFFSLATKHAEMHFFLVMTGNGLSENYFAYSTIHPSLVKVVPFSSMRYLCLRVVFFSRCEEHR